MTPLSFLIVLALLATVAVLGLGIFSMVHGGDFDREHAGQFMTARVGLQGVTVVLLLAAFVLA